MSPTIEMAWSEGLKPQLSYYAGTFLTWANTYGRGGVNRQCEIRSKEDGGSPVFI